MATAQKKVKKEKEATEFEVLADMVTNLDKIKSIQGKDSENYKKQHDVVVRAIGRLNQQFGKGFTNISDVRSINTIVKRNEKNGGGIVYVRN